MTSLKKVGNGINKVCVFSSSSNYLPDVYYQAAYELGVLMAKEGFELIYGGGNVGTMYKNAQAVKEFGGKVIGVMPEKLYNLGLENSHCDELHITKCMRSRKEKLDELGDAVIAIAGGYGTLEELSEMIVQKQLGYNSKAIVILNTNGFYDNLIKFFETMISEKFAHEDMRGIYYVANTPKDAIDYLKTYEPKTFDVVNKLILKTIK